MARGRSIALSAVALAAGVAAPSSQPLAASGCALWASERGSDGNPGTRQLPFRTVEKLVASLRAGGTGCLAPGSTFVEHVSVRRGGAPGAPIRLRTAPGRRAVIRGGITVERGADDVVLAYLVVQGEGRRSGIVVVHGNRVGLIRNAISGPGYLNRFIPCVLVDGATGTVIDGNEIHDCTRATGRNVYSAGVHVAQGVQTTIENNFIYRNVGDGIALTPDARATRIARNIIHGNVSGIYFAGDGRTASSETLVVDNIISFSGRYSVHADWPGGTVGTANLVTRNCVWKGFGGNFAGRGFVATRNRIASPRYLNRWKSFALRRGPCFRKRPLSYRYSRTDLGTPVPLLGHFVVGYHLRALPRAVQVVRLSVDKLVPGTRVAIRCAKGCRGFETVVAGRTGRARSRFLSRRWLRLGTVIELRARKSGWVGSYARVRVTGLPRGVAISHACLSGFDRPAPVPCGRYRRG